LAYPKLGEAELSEIKIATEFGLQIGQNTPTVTLGVCIDPLAIEILILKSLNGLSCFKGLLERSLRGLPKPSVGFANSVLNSHALNKELNSVKKQYKLTEKLAHDFLNSLAAL
jgi:hypothetical protein